MSSLVETINGRVFSWDKGAYGCGVYRVDGKPLHMQAWAAARADAVRASNRAAPRVDRTTNVDSIVARGVL